MDMAKKAGFALLASSEMNANPRDTKDYPRGVWTLPPTFALGAVGPHGLKKWDSSYDKPARKWTNRVVSS